MPAANCPSREDLVDYVVGRLPDDTSERVAEHIESCSNCQAELATIDDADDTLMGNLRQPVVDDPYLAESHCGVAVARAKSVAGQPAGREGSTSRLSGELGDYRLLEELGRGGMGTVYKALHTKLDRVVAVKVVPKSRLADDRAVARFEREMKAIGRLDHPNIVGAHDAREINDMPVLIMEYVDGMDLGELVRRLGRLRTGDACELVRQAALGLEYAHQHGLVHRDVKPSNVMLTRRGEVKLLDLGLARFHVESGKGEEVTGTGQAMGTADYMAPEQVSDSREVDIRADVYSLGCTLYKLLSGQAPFSGPEHKGAFEKMTAHVEKPVPPIRELAADVPDGLVSILDRMLAKSPEDRFATPAELAEALEPFCVGAELSNLIAEGDQRGEMAAETPVEEAPAGRRSAPAREAEAEPLAAGRRGVRPPVVVALMLSAFAAGFAAGVVITIKRDGRDTRVTVPDGSEVTIHQDGNLDVTPPAESTAATGPRATAVADLKALQGEWEIVRLEKGENFEDLSLFWRTSPGTRIGIRDDVLVISPLSMSRNFFNFVIDPAQTPKTIDVGQRPHLNILGIYELEENELRICLAKTLSALGGQQRPTRFSVTSGAADANVVLRRVREPGQMAAFEAIQGSWEVVSIEKGKAVDAWRDAGAYRITLDPADVRIVEVSSGAVHFRRHTTPHGGDVMDLGVALSFQIDPTKTPRTIDLYFVEPAALGIYEIDGDQLKLCLELPPSGSQPETLQRPSSFTVDPDSRRVLLQLRRWEPRMLFTSPAGIAETVGKDTKPKATTPSALPATAGPRAAAVADLKGLQGEWEIVTLEKGENFEDLSLFWFTAEETGIGIEDDGLMVSPWTKTREFFTFAIDPTGTPKTIDILHGDDLQALGIYELEGDRLRLCLATPLSAIPGQQRPTVFSVASGVADACVVLKRVEAPGRIAAWKALHGNWEVASVLMEDGAGPWTAATLGKKTLDPADVKTVQITPAMVSLRQGDLRDQARRPPLTRGEPVAHLIYEIDSTRSPATIALYDYDPWKGPRAKDFDWQAALVAWGIYEIDGGQLKLCLMLAAHGVQADAQQRPTDFTLKPGSSNVLFVLRRWDPVEETPAEPAETQPVPVDAAAQLQALQGQWEVVSAEKGEACDLGTAGPGYLPRFDPAGVDLVKIREDVRLYDIDGGEFTRLKYVVNPTGMPKTIDLLYLDPSRREDQVIALGIYELGEDQLRICLTKNLPMVLAEQRPAGFAIEPGSHDVLFTLRRYRPSPEQEALQGWWDVVSATYNGRETSGDPAEKMVVSFSDFYFLFGATADPGATPPDVQPGRSFRGPYCLDPAKQPKAITVLMLGGAEPKVLFGIYELKGGQLRIAYCEGGPRPTEFVSEPGSNVTLLVLHRGVAGTEAKRLDGANAEATARQAALRDQTANNGRQIGLAMHLYHDSFRTFPPAYSADKDGKPLLSWRVLILPYIQQAPLYEQFHLDEPWDSPHNRKLLEKMPAVYRSPTAPPESTSASVFAVVGPGTAFPGKQGVPLPEFRDGLSNTILVVEAKRDIPWTKPEDIPYDPQKPIPELGGVFPGGFHAVLADGSVEFIPDGFEPKDLRTLITTSGNEALPEHWPPSSVSGPQ